MADIGSLYIYVFTYILQLDPGATLRIEQKGLIPTIYYLFGGLTLRSILAYQILLIYALTYSPKVIAYFFCRAFGLVQMKLFIQNRFAVQVTNGSFQLGILDKEVAIYVLCSCFLGLFVNYYRHYPLFEILTPVSLNGI